MKDDILIVGGGPAGMMAGLLFACAGLSVTVVEKHVDFLRDFRGDTVHPSTMELFHQLGMLDELLLLPHSRIDQFALHIAGQKMRVADMRYLPVAAPYIAMMPQWDLLDFIARKAGEFGGFKLRMETEAVAAITHPSGRVCGVKTRSGEELKAGLVIAADGRRSILRDEAKLPLEQLGAPMDVFWFRIDKPADYGGDIFGTARAGQFMILIDRGSYFQCAYVFRKGEAKAVRERGLPQFRDDLRILMPDLADAFDQIGDWDQVKMLEVALDRLTCWHRPGLLAIGDAAHAMSPIGGVGINVAVQDAVVAANILAGPMVAGENPDPLLEQVQSARWRSVTRMQRVQKIAQDQVIEPLLNRSKPIKRPFLPLRILNRFGILRRIPGRVIGLGFDRPSIDSPNAFD